MGGVEFTGVGSDTTLVDIVEHPCITVRINRNSGTLGIDRLPKSSV
jgi:hypothetical protein